MLEAAGWATGGEGGEYFRLSALLYTGSEATGCWVAMLAVGGSSVALQ